MHVLAFCHGSPVRHAVCTLGSLCERVLMQIMSCEVSMLGSDLP